MSKKLAQSIALKTSGSSARKMSHKEFTERAIRRLRTPGYRGIHVVYSGFNAAFRQYFDQEPRPVIDALVAEGFLMSQLTRGGVIITLASDVVEKTGSGPSDALATILTDRV